MPFHTLYTTNSSMEAHLVMAKPIENGIEVFLKDEFTLKIPVVKKTGL